MKLRRYLTVLLVCLTVAALLAPASAGASPDELSDARYALLSDPGYLDFMTGNQIRNLEYVIEDGTGFARVHFQPSGVDPYIFLPLSAVGGAIDCSEYKYLAIRVRSDFETGCNLYYGTSVEGGLDESKNMRSARGINATGDWETVVFYFGDTVKWTGYLSTARFDPYANVPEGMDYMDIAWFAFVKKEADLEKLDVSLDEFNAHETYTRRPVYSTPDRTKPPENTFKAALVTPETADDPGNSRSGFSPVVLITVTAVLAVAIAVSALGIVYVRSRKEK
jgi:hypothetical protein